MNVMVHKQAGDTLVEVLMAIVIISIIIVGAITVMNRGLTAAQIAMEHSQVRLSVNGQIEMLRFARDQYIQSRTGPSAAQWSAVVTATNTQPVNYDSGCSITSGKQAFYMTKSGTQVTRNNYTVSVPNTVALPGTGMWIETVASTSGVSPAYVDLVVRACWAGVGSTAQQRTVTAVRLYDPSR
jgi:prepilin-type N-terminal cleavage/methylation domain-containing protein